MHPARTLALAILFAAAAQPAFAAWPNLPGNNLPVCTATNIQQWPAIAADGSGGAIVTWSDQRNGANFDIYAQHILATGAVDPAWPGNGRVLCAAANAQVIPQIVPDGAGGAIVGWYDLRTGTYDIYAQHVLASGAVDPAWPVDGRALCTAASTQAAVTLASDGAGGAIAAWYDGRSGTTYDIYAQHVLASGAVDPLWPVDGRALCTGAGDQMYPTIVGDGSGGAIVTWYDGRNGSSNYDIYAQHVLASGAVDPAWTANGAPVCNAGGSQFLPTLVTDGAGGALITWYDARGASNDIYVQHVLANGTMDINYFTNGDLVCGAPGNQLWPRIVSDGSGGAIIAWYDVRSGSFGDVYAQHMLASVGPDPLWPVDGLAVCTAAGDQQGPVLVADGSGGAIVAWYDGRNGVSQHIYAQHVLAAGATDYNWPADGRAISTASGYQEFPALVGDGLGGGIIAWQDFRVDQGDIYAQRVVKSGYLGTPEAVMAGVRDVPNDNGGHVRVSWNASYLEFDPFLNYTYYSLFRQIPARLAAQAMSRGSRVHGAGEAALAPGDLVATLSGTATLYWEYIATLSGFMVPGYSYDAATTGDSLGAGNPKTLFMVQTRAGSLVMNSLPDSGYSVDNIPPVTPAPFAANYAAGVSHLHWNPNPETDLAGYRLYRGVGAFTPSPATLIASPPDTGYADAAGATYTYKLTAVDVHGNESPVATIAPTAITGVDGGVVVRELALSPASPNPATRGTTLRFALPGASPVKLGIFDAAGRLVRALSGGTLSAGEHAAEWDLRDGSGHNVGAGLYFARLEALGRTIVRRIAVTP